MKLFAAASLMVATLFSGSADSASFRDFPVEIYQGEIHLPDFAGAQKEYADFRIRLGDAAKQPQAQFAGSWVVAQIGCGTSCTFAEVIDHRTGEIVDLPIGGEMYPYMTLSYRPDSRLMKATWIANPYENGTCMIEEWSFEDGQFQFISIKPHYPREDCEK